MSPGAKRESLKLSFDDQDYLKKILLDRVKRVSNHM